MDVRVPQTRQALAGGLADRESGQAPLDIAAVGLDVQVGRGLDDRPLGGA
jgi:hypothetical protein